MSSRIPGIYEERFSAPAFVIVDPVHLPGGGIMNGDVRDATSATGDIYTLPTGTLLGIETATGLWKQSVVGKSTVVYVANGGTVTTTPAVATELIRRLGGQTGSVVFTGPPAAAGTVAATVCAVTAINATLGTITLTCAVNKVVGSLISVNDGSQTPLTVLLDDTRIVDENFEHVDCGISVPIGGTIYLENLVNSPADTSTLTWIMTQLNTNGQFIRADAY